MKENTREISVLKQRILQYLDSKGVSKYECYKNTGITNGVLSQSNGMSEDNILRFLSYYNDISSDWLLTGQGSILRNNQAQPTFQPTAQPIVQQDLLGEAAAYYKMYEKEKEENKALLKQVGSLEERLRQLESSPAEEPVHPPLIEKAVDAFTPDSLGGSGKDFIHTRKPTPSKTSSASKIL